MSPQGLQLSMPELVGHPHRFLEWLEEKVTLAVRTNLEIRVGGLWEGPDDAIFLPFNVFVESAMLIFPLRAVRTWLVQLAPLVANAEAQVGHIHKGAPLYNTGLCFFFSGDLPRAMQFIAAAAEEDERRQPGTGRKLLTAQGFSEDLLLRPLYNWLAFNVGSDYQAATGCALTPQEIKDLVDFLGGRVSDALLLLAALHRVVAQVEPPDNASSKLQRVRALADVLVVFESSLRDWQKRNIGQLHDRSVVLLSPNAAALAAFQAAKARYSGRDWEDAGTVNDMIQEELIQFAAATTAAAKAGIATFIAYRLRNSLLHVLDEDLILYHCRSVLLRLLGMGLISVRLSKFGAQGTIASI